jgi:hypothetical protein
VWNMSKRDTLALCAGLQRHNAPCQAMSPQGFAELANRSARLSGGPADPPGQRSEGSQ